MLWNDIDFEGRNTRVVLDCDDHQYSKTRFQLLFSRARQLG